MGHEPLKSRLAALRQRSRRALTLYTKMGRDSVASHARFSELQISEWRSVNEKLIHELAECLEEANSRRLNQLAFSIRDRWYEAWRTSESDLHAKREELLNAAQQSDFVRAASLSEALVVLKAHQEAAHAAYQELQGVLEKSRVTPPEGMLTSMIRDSGDLKPEGYEPDEFEGDDLESGEVVGQNVIPFMRRRS